MFSRLTALGAAITVVVGLSGVPTEAYNISVKGAVHERITRLAERCAALDPMPERCPLPTTSRELDKVDWAAGNYWYAVRWPDDPTRQGNMFGGVKFGINVGLGRCDHYLKPGKPFAGVLCNSHYGALQFLHAMSSKPGETPAETRALVAAWARFAFGVASGRIMGTAPFCATVRAQGEPLAAALAPPEFPFCKDGRSPAWKVRTLFVLRCRNPFSSQICSEAIGDDADRYAKLNATGALLHLIQDSYSRSHTGRGIVKPKGPYSARIDCLPVSAFYLYRDNKKLHGAADRLPTFSDDCRREGAIIDPVTASARMLKYVGIGDAKAEDAAIAMIEREVLGAP